MNLTNVNRYGEILQPQIYFIIITAANQFHSYNIQFYTELFEEFMKS